MISRLIFESCPLGPFWSALIAGYAIVGLDGLTYITPLGELYLEALA